MSFILTNEIHPQLNRINYFLLLKLNLWISLLQMSNLRFGINFPNSSVYCTFDEFEPPTFYSGDRVGVSQSNYQILFHFVNILGIDFNCYNLYIADIGERGFYYLVYCRFLYIKGIPNVLTINILYISEETLQVNRE